MERLWVLTARSLAGEATPAEAEELKHLLEKHPDDKVRYEALQDYWHHSYRAEEPDVDQAYLSTLSKIRSQAALAEIPMPAVARKAPLFEPIRNFAPGSSYAADRSGLGLYRIAGQ